MIKNLVFDLGNVLIEWNSEKILTYFEPEKELMFIDIFDKQTYFIGKNTKMIFILPSLHCFSALPFGLLRFL